MKDLISNQYLRSKKLRPVIYSILVTIATLVCLAVDRFFWNLLFSTPFLLPMGAVLLSTLFDGRLAGMVSSILGVLGIAYLRNLDRSSFEFTESELFQSGVFLALSAFVGEIIVRGKEAVERSQVGLVQFKQLIESVKDYAIIELSSDGHVKSWNEGAQRIKGYSAEEIIGIHFSRFYSEEDRQAGKPDRLLEIAKNVGRVEDEGWRVRKDGSRFWASVVMTARRGLEGETIGFIKITRDWTEHKNQLDALRSAEHRFRTLLEAAPDAMVIVDRQGKILMLNEEAEKVFGYARTELIGQFVEVLIPENLRHRHVQQRENYSTEPRRRPMGVGLNLVGRRKDGSELPIDAALSPIDMGNETLFMAVVRDVTERKKIEDQRAFLVAIGKTLSQSLNPIETLDVLAKQLIPELGDWCMIDLVLADRKFHRVVCTHADPNKQQLVSELKAFHPKKVSERDAMIESIFSSGQKSTLTTELDVLASLFDVEEERRLALEAGIKSYLLIPLLAGDQQIGTITIVSSKRHYSAEDREFAKEIGSRVAVAVDNGRHYQDAQTAIRMREDVLAIVSHDLRNPLSAIKLTANLIRNIVQEQNKTETTLRDVLEKFNRLAGIIDATADRAHRLVNDLLDFAKIESGTMALEVTRVCASELIRQAVESHRLLAQEKQVVLEMNLPTNDCWVFCDVGRVLQVFSNLIDNAIKFTPPQGHIQCGVSSCSPKLVLFVKDSGKGIPESLMPHVFDRYWQARESKRMGAGLGLSISRGIIRAHGGRIWVESQLGKGSQFFFTLPRIEPLQAPLADPSLSLD